MLFLLRTDCLIHLKAWTKPCSIGSPRPQGRWHRFNRTWCISGGHTCLTSPTTRQHLRRRIGRHRPRKMLYPLRPVTYVARPFLMRLPWHILHFKLTKEQKHSEEAALGKRKFATCLVRMMASQRRTTEGSCRDGPVEVDDAPLNPKPQTPNPKPQTPNSKLQIQEAPRLAGSLQLSGGWQRRFRCWATIPSTSLGDKFVAWGAGFRVWGLGFGVWGLGLGFRGFRGLDV